MKITDDMHVHIMKVMEGEYNVPYNIIDPVVLDIGANIGAFTRWAAARWKGAQVHSYEPMPSTYELLLDNTEDLPNVTTYNVAVGAEITNQKPLFKGLHNIGEASLYKGSEQSEESVDVEMISAADLPQAHIVKIDTEGSEIDILENMTFQPHVFMLEYHSETKRRRVEELLVNYTLIKANVSAPNRGVVVYLHNNLLPPSEEAPLKKRSVVTSVQTRTLKAD